MTTAKRGREREREREREKEIIYFFSSSLFRLFFRSPSRKKINQTPRAVATSRDGAGGESKEGVSFCFFLFCVFVMKKKGQPSTAVLAIFSSLFLSRPFSFSLLV